MAFFSENYLVTKPVLEKFTVAAASSVTEKLQVESPESAIEHSYASLFSTANRSFFQREYTIALRLYQELRYTILVQSHPEMPATPGGSAVVNGIFHLANMDALFELSRQHYLRTKPGDPIEMKINWGPLVQPGLFTQPAEFAPFVSIGLDAKKVNPKAVDILRESARDFVRNNSLDSATKTYTTAKTIAETLGDTTLVADLTMESAAIMATYATGAERKTTLQKAKGLFDEAQKYYESVGDEAALAAVKTNLKAIEADINAASTPAGPAGPAGPGTVGPATHLGHLGHLGAAIGAAPLAHVLAIQPKRATQTVYKTRSNGTWTNGAEIVTNASKAPAKDRLVGLVSAGGAKNVSLSSDKYKPQLETIYKARITATKLEELKWYEQVVTNFVAYIPHLYFFVLPVAIGDTYVELGLYDKGIAEYKTALQYAFINHGIEAKYVWLKMAQATIRKGDELFRRERRNDARAVYETLISTAGVIPNGSQLYNVAPLAPVKKDAQEVAKRLLKQPFTSVNPSIYSVISQAYIHLQQIAGGLNILGLGDNDFPVFRFKYLQSVATYLADNAIQAERTFITFRSSAEKQKMERIQLENAVALNQSAVSVEEARLLDAKKEVEIASKTETFSQIRADNAEANLNDWETIGWELATVNAALAWASNAANDQDIKYTGVYYHGESHDFDTDVEDFYDSVGEWREWLNYDIQRNRLDRQVAEADAELAIAKARREQAELRVHIQELNVELAEVRLEGAVAMLEYSQDQMFDEDLWFRLAAGMQDLARWYLDKATYAAFLMQRAYDLEFDRNLHRIRTDYGLGGADGLLGGDHLKRDIASFAVDYLQNAQKKNPVRLLLSLREEFPHGWKGFTQTGELSFRTHLEIWDRKFPGTIRRKLKKVEIFVEGLVPSEGSYGLLEHQGISTEWARGTNSYFRRTRVTPPDRLVLSSYQFRRDISVFQPSEEMLDVFENLGPEGNWRLQLPPAVNDLDYQAISDIKVAFYFDADFDPDLRQHVENLYPKTGGKVIVLSSRFHFPDSYFHIDSEKAVTFQLHPGRFAKNHTNPQLQRFAVRIFRKAGAAPGPIPLVIGRLSDGNETAVTTTAQGFILSNITTMAPFADWKGDTAVDSFVVRFPDDFDTTQIDDIQLTIDYTFNYRTTA
ncbi:MAG: hypothetical protein HUU55_04920 [Myxococcales bacterium]|nr:hypothetical protein [Myxococcales bacterium]